MEELWYEYLDFLIKKCGVRIGALYKDLLNILHNIRFTWEIGRDDNREADGVSLRDDFYIPDECSEYEIDFYERPCSVLEMMVALAIRVDNEYIGNPAESHPGPFFFEMIENLGLRRFIQGKYSEDDVYEIVERWLKREFDKDGKGSPFPVKHDRRDQRDLEIWDQMISYINEKY